MATSEYEVLPECPARTHNTMHVARPFRRGGKPAPIKCICPHADELREKYRREDLQRSLERLRRSRETRAPEMRIKGFQVAERKARIPFDYAGGLCTTPAGREIADNGFNTKISLSGIEARGKAKRLCSVCPLQQACLANIRFEEGDAPGSMDGVYGGMDPYERQGRRLVWSSAEGRVVEMPMIGVAA